MRNGMKIYDADTHVQPSAEVMEPYLPAIVRERIPNLDTFKSPIKIGLAGEVREEILVLLVRESLGGGVAGHQCVHTHA